MFSINLNEFTKILQENSRTEKLESEELVTYKMSRQDEKKNYHLSAKFFKKKDTQAYQLTPYNSTEKRKL